MVDRRGGACIVKTYREGMTTKIIVLGKNGGGAVSFLLLLKWKSPPAGDLRALVVIYSRRSDACLPAS